MMFFTLTISHQTSHFIFPLASFAKSASRIVLDPGKLQVRSGLPVCRTFSGDHTVVETPVPIPNTVVKHPGPMIVHTSAKVGIASFFVY